MNSFENKVAKKRPLSIKIADYLTSRFGTFGFLMINVVFFTLWITLNSQWAKGLGFPVFDPHPYFFLTMIVSLEAIGLSIVVLISQHRQGQIDKFRNEIDLQINLIAEREITKALKLLKEIRGKDIKDPELDEMILETDTTYIERQLEKQIFEKPTPILDNVKKPVQNISKALFDR